MVVIFGAIFLVKELFFTPSSSPVESILPANTCPDELITQGKVSAKYKGLDVNLSQETYEWVLKNCRFGDDSRPTIANLGVDLAIYNPSTGKSGSVYYDAVAIQNNWGTSKLFFEFGSILPGNKVSPEMAFLQLSLGTPVVALTAGRIDAIEYQAESNDYNLSLVINDYWRVLYDHVTELTVKNGDTVEANAQLGKVSVNKDGKTGYVEIMIKEGDGKSTTINHCPMLFLAEEKKSQLVAAITSIMQNVETLAQDSSLYDQANQVIAGCVVESIVD